MSTTSSKEIKTVEQTKTKVSWKPASILDTVHGLDLQSYNYRWVSKEKSNLAKKQAEGWSFVSELDGDKITHERPQTIKTGSSLQGSGTEIRDVVLMKMPKEVALARADYYKQKADDNIRQLAKEPKKLAAANGGSVFGTISIGTRIIE